MKVVLMEKLHEGDDQELNELNRALAEISHGLNVEAKTSGLQRGGLPEIEVKGEDREVLVNLLKERWGVAPMNLSEIEVTQVLKSFIVGPPSGEGLYIDIGIRIPEYLNAVYPTSSIKSQLADGQQLSVKRIVEHFCLAEGLPIETIVTEIHEGKVVVELTDEQNETLWRLDSDPFHKLIVTGCLKNRLRKIVREPRIRRSVLKTAQLSLNTHLVYCLAGVNADAVKRKIEKALSCPVYSFKPSLRRMSVYC